jgi:hypothetical protein
MGKNILFHVVGPWTLQGDQCARYVCGFQTQQNSLFSYISSKWSQMKISKTEKRCLIDRLIARSSNTLKSHHTSNPAFENSILFQRDEQMLKTHDFLRTKVIIPAFPAAVWQVALLFVTISERNRTQ